jgi:hypothetical protein
MILAGVQNQNFRAVGDVANAFSLRRLKRMNPRRSTEQTLMQEMDRSLPKLGSSMLELCRLCREH